MNQDILKSLKSRFESTYLCLDLDQKISGDFNALEYLKSLFRDGSSGLYSVLYPNGPTCFSSVRNPPTIDLVLTNQSQLCGPLVTLADFDSDFILQ